MAIERRGRKQLAAKPPAFESEVHPRSLTLRTMPDDVLDAMRKGVAEYEAEDER